jgi:hypothetical protein
MMTNKGFSLMTPFIIIIGIITILVCMQMFIPMADILGTTVENISTGSTMMAMVWLLPLVMVLGLLYISFFGESNPGQNQV